MVRSILIITYFCYLLIRINPLFIINRLLFDSSMTLTPSVISDGRLDYTILAGRSARPYHWPGDLPDLPESPCGCYTTLAVAGR